jgi:hypothetical protein
MATVRGCDGAAAKADPGLRLVCASLGTPPDLGDHVGETTFHLREVSFRVATYPAYDAIPESDRVNAADHGIVWVVATRL